MALPLRTAFYLLLVLALWCKASKASTVSCPELTCDEGRKGYVWDHSSLGYLLEKKFKKKEEALEEECSDLCSSAPECAVWLFAKDSTGAYCKLWKESQNPCLPSPPYKPTSVHFDPQPAWGGDYTIGGNCHTEQTHPGKAAQPEGNDPDAEAGEANVRKKARFGVDGVGAKDKETISKEMEKWLEVSGEKVEKQSCPPLRCNSPVFGFLFDHKQHGHLATVVTGVGPRRPHACFKECRRTDGCAFWMYEMRGMEGRCKMWSKEQSPCEPEDPNAPSTAHFHKLRVGSYVVGGNCKPGVSPKSKT